MTVTVMLEAEVIEDQQEEFYRFLTSVLPDTRQYSGFISIDILSEHNNNKVIFYSQWQSIANYQAYLVWRTQTGVLDLLTAKLTGEPKIRFFDTVD